MNYKPIIIVAGEPNSIFLEIFFKTKKKYTFKNPIILIVSKKLLLRQMEKLNFKFQINEIDINKNFIRKLNNKKINIINVNYTFKNCFDKISNKSNTYIKKSFDIALKLLKKNNYSGLINGPISKKNFLRDKFPGITEYLGDKEKSNVAMIIYNKNLSVSPLTTHLPLKNVYKKITKKKIIDHANLINLFYKKRLKRIPRIAITGLNPHCESNYRSSEEKNIIKPAIHNLIKKKIKIKGPFAADTMFLNENYKHFDVIIGMYHDQVLTPIKAIFGFNAINITLGLPYIRISPDHGPNSRMLGKNKSNPQSLIEALKFLDK